MSNNLVKYEPFTVEDAAESEKELQAGNAQFHELQQGTNRHRVVPAPTGRKTFVVVSGHRVEVPGVDNTVVMHVCPRAMARQRCRTCEVAEKLAASDNRVDVERAKGFWPRKKVYTNSVDRANEEAGPKILTFGKTIHEALLQIRKEENIDFTDPFNGCDVLIHRKGVKLSTKYRVSAARETSRLAKLDETIADWVASQSDLGRFARVPSDREVCEQFEEAGGADLFDVDVAGRHQAASGITPGRARAPSVADDAIDAEVTDAAVDPLD